MLTDNILSMDLILCERIKNRMNELNLDWDELENKIDNKYPNEKGSSCHSRMKDIRLFPSRQEIENGIKVTKTINPTYKTLLQLSDILECDITYLLGEHEHPTHEINDICAATGLSEKAASLLISRKDSVRYSFFIETLNNLFSMNDEFEDFLFQLYVYKNARNEESMLNEKYFSQLGSSTENENPFSNDYSEFEKFRNSPDGLRLKETKYERIDAELHASKSLSAIMKNI